MAEGETTPPPAPESAVENKPEAAAEDKDTAAAKAAVLRPISEAEPVGSDPKLTDDFDRVFNELAKLESLGGGEPDWPMVLAGSAKLIDTVSKDLRCLGWWVHARFRLQGAVGLRTGLVALAACAETFKAAGLHPKRDKAKAAALDWLGTRLELDVPLHLKSAPAADLEVMRKSLDELQASLQGACASFEGLSKARAAVKGVKVEVPKPAPGAKPAPVARPVAAAPAATAAPAAPPAPTVPSELEGLVEEMASQAAGLAAGAGESAFSLRLRRMAAWLGTPEPLPGGKKYDCESIVPKLRMELDQIFNNKRWPELLERTESLFPQHPFCLDLTFWAAHAAGEVVGMPARDALAGELVALTIRSPKLSKGVDRTGQPLASAATRAFVSQLMAPKVGGAAPVTVAAAPAGEGGAASTPAVAPGASFETLPADVDALLAQGKTADAVRLGSAATAGLSGRGAFYRHVALAERLQAAGANPLAFSMFRALMAQLRTATLSQWEPGLEARCIRGYLQGARSTKQTVEGERELLDALMLLDPGAAVGLV